jgi:hypothetical protein
VARDWLSEAGLDVDARRALERSRRGHVKSAVDAGRRASPAHVVFISQLGDDRSPWDLPGNECRAWAYVLEADTRHHMRVREEPGALDGYEIAIVELTANLYDLPPLLRERFVDLRVVGLLEGAVGGVGDQQIDEQARFVECARSLDMVGVLVDSSVPYYRLLVDDPRRVQWLGVPYPKAWTDSQPRRPRAEKPRVIELAAGLAPGRNGLPGVLIVRRVRQDFPDVHALAYVSSGAEAAALRELDPSIECRPHRFWREYYAEHLDAWAVLSLDARRTWGRLPLDCASAFLPYVGSDATHAARSVGVLLSDPFDVEQAERHLRTLLVDDALYDSVAAEQYARLEPFAEPASRRRFWRALAAAGVPYRRRPILRQR